MRREGSNNAKTIEDKSTGRGTGEATNRSASFAQACEGILAQRDLRAGEQALATWRQAAEAVKNEAYVVYDSANVDYDDTLRTGKRQSKAKPSRRRLTSLNS
jgi:hypothetical protein